jgi:glycerol kinase
MTDWQECKVSVFKEAIENAGENASFVAAIDQGTSSSRFLLYTRLGEIAASAQVEFTQIFPPDYVGWHEHDPFEIWDSVVTCMDAVADACHKASVPIVIQALGITNQRETIIAWNSATGRVYYNAIVWDDVRTTDVAAKIAHGHPNVLRDKTGLPIASYFSATKVRWLLEHVQELRRDLLDEATRGQVRFGTVDTWLTYQLTGGRRTPITQDRVAHEGGRFVTDVTNASRWLFLNLHTVSWDPHLISLICTPTGIDLPLSALPIILPSSCLIGHCSTDSGVPPMLQKVPIAGLIGDQQAALFGQAAFEPGEAKNTYGTGLFLMMNTGTTPVASAHGLLTTLAYQVGEQSPPVYALEGSVSHSGSTIQWLRDQLQIIHTASESETLAAHTTSNDGLYFVPAFAGLFAPYWRPDARACIVGMTASHNRFHIARAALEAAAYQTKEVFDAMNIDSHVPLKELRVDGGGTANKLLMQFQADMIQVPVVKPMVMETTSRGAAFCAGLAVGFWKDQDELKALWKENMRFIPAMEHDDRRKNWLGWKKAVTKSLDWIDS